MTSSPGFAPDKAFIIEIPKHATPLSVNQINPQEIDCLNGNQNNLIAKGTIYRITIDVRNKKRQGNGSLERKKLRYSDTQTVLIHAKPSHHTIEFLGIFPTSCTALNASPTSLLSATFHKAFWEDKIIQEISQKDSKKRTEFKLRLSKAVTKELKGVNQYNIIASVYTKDPIHIAQWIIQEPFITEPDKTLPVDILVQVPNNQLSDDKRRIRFNVAFRNSKKTIATKVNLVRLS